MRKKNPRLPQFKFQMGGAPRYLNFKPSRAMLASMQSGMRPNIPDQKKEDERKIVEYVKGLMQRRGIAVPVSNSERDIRAEIIYDYITSDKSPDLKRSQRWRPCAVEWQSGIERDQYEQRGRRRLYAGRKWETDSVALRFEIPNWDFVPTCIEVTPANHHLHRDNSLYLC